MSSHDHHNNHSEEAKTVSFRTPLIMALVTVLLILLAVSTCDNKHHGSCECKEDCSEECMKKCEAGDHSGHEDIEEHTAEHAAEPMPAVETEEHTAVSDSTIKVETTVVDPAIPAEHTEHH
jgi:hypothetical protein